MKSRFMSLQLPDKITAMAGVRVETTRTGLLEEGVLPMEDQIKVVGMEDKIVVDQVEAMEGHHSSRVATQPLAWDLREVEEGVVMEAQVEEAMLLDHMAEGGVLQLVVVDHNSLGEHL